VHSFYFECVLESITTSDDVSERRGGMSREQLRLIRRGADGFAEAAIAILGEARDGGASKAGRNRRGRAEDGRKLGLPAEEDANCGPARSLGAGAREKDIV